MMSNTAWMFIHRNETTLKTLIRKELTMTIMPPRDWRLSDEEFQAIKEAFDRKDPSARTTEWIRAEIANLDREIERILPERQETWREAILILLQGRNFLARYIGEQERLIPEECYEGGEQEAPAPDPIEGKHVALYSPMPRVVAALVQSLGVSNNPAPRYRGYERISNLLQAIFSGQVCGVIALHGRESHSALGTLRHDMKNLRGQDYAAAQRYLFPPCIDLAAPHNLIEIIHLIWELQNGTYQAETRHFDLAGALPILGVHMLLPKRNLLVAIVDDEPTMMDGMKRILDVWPGVSVEAVLQEKGMPVIPLHANVILLDEMMAEGMTGTTVYEWLESRRFQGIIASTTGGSRPPYVRHHFQQKGIVATNRQAAEAFVRFMNGLLQLT